MKVSVIIPVYNMADSLYTSVKSILSQTYENIEIILIDDGSKDNSLEICNRLSKENNNIKTYHTPNRGSGPARNLGIEKATGEFGYFPDADDYIEPNAIELMVKAISTSKCDLVVFGYKYLNRKGKIVGKKRYPNISFSGDDIRSCYENHCSMGSEFGIQGAPWNKCFSLKIIREHGVEFPALRRHQDEVFIARYVKHSQKVTFIDNVLYTYYKNDTKKEWMKYPLEYIDNVEELKKYKMDIILPWQYENKIMKNQIESEYICNYIKSLELSFNKKFLFTPVSRLKWLIEKVRQEGFTKAIATVNLGEGFKYQKMVIDLVNNQKYFRLYLLLKMKVFYKINIERILNY
jgi:glycosyltransferase involved in cell wall biosynthesis